MQSLSHSVSEAHVHVIEILYWSLSLAQASLLRFRFHLLLKVPDREQAVAHDGVLALTRTVPASDTSATQLWLCHLLWSQISKPAFGSWHI